MRAALVASVLACALLATACGGGDDESAASSDGDCASVEAPATRESETREKPSQPLDAGTTYSLVFETSCGSFTVQLDQELAPITSASLVALARDGFYDDTSIHRVVPDFVIQGGDPTGTGAGGPGYSTVDRPPQDAQYVEGVVAMAKTQLEAPGTAGSQFFVVTGEDAGLPPDYALLGKVTSGQEVVDKIGVVEVGPDEQPVDPVVIRQIRITES
jgi:peptidyl-prolyl cis-trans isomerase B (cyclophilin B)